MSKYFAFYQGKYRDWKFKVDSDGFRHCFYLDEILIGHLFKYRKNEWAVVPAHPTGLGGSVSGFRSRHSAAEFALQFMKAINEPTNKKNEWKLTVTPPDA
jgi:hypothetical protein